jgi:ABC-type uncharacterized transport system permease subunit
VSVLPYAIVHIARLTSVIAIYKDYQLERQREMEERHERWAQEWDGKQQQALC